MSDQVPELDLPERLLKTLSQFNQLLKQVFSTDLDAGITPDDPQALHAGIVGDLASQATRIPEDIEWIVGFLTTANNGGLDDDKKYLLEQTVDLAASLPSDSASLKGLTTGMIDKLWNNLLHPPLSYVGDEFRYRTADGSNNNRLMPHLGKAGSPYARTVEPKVKLPPTLPDAGLIFDELFARGPEFREHPNKMSSTLFYLATIIIHDIFRTNDVDWNRVDNSSYLDLSPLYGNNIEQQQKVRLMKDGLLKPDTFAEIRLLGFPPGVCALLICFNRYHNYIARELATINEGGRYTLPKDASQTQIDKRDNDLFQTARLITCGLYVNIILTDYVRTILNLQHSQSSWVLDPRVDPEKKYGPSGMPEGVGNQVSVEFNLVYRWHSTISKRDEKWTNDFFKQFFPNADPSTMDLQVLRHGFRKFLVDTEKLPAEERTFGNLQRTANGAFKDEDLIKILTESTEDVAGAFGARNVPVVMRAIEMLGIQQARKWNVATLNEFRQFFGMIPHETFSDISSDPDVAQSLETLYGSPDLVELYPGLVSEDAKEPRMPGAGLCPGYTISKAILADAVTLVRGDRFYTVDYNATTLTNWGFTQIQSSPQIAGGGVMYKLLHNAFPRWYKGGSVYSMFPFTVPSETQKILTKLGKVQDYHFSKPAYKPQPQQLETWQGTVDVLHDQVRFKVPWGPHTYDMTKHDYMLSGDTPANAAQHAFIGKALYPPGSTLEIRELYQEITMELIKDKSRKLRTGLQLDIVSRVINPSHAIAMAKLFHMPIKTEDHTIGLLTPQSFYTMMVLLFAYVFLDEDDSKSFQLRQGALQCAAAIGKITEGVVRMVQNQLFAELFGYLNKEWHGNSYELAEHYGTKLIERLSEGGQSVEDVAWALVPTMAASVGTQTQGVAQVVDLLLQDEYKHHWAEIRTLAMSSEPAAFEKLEKYALECLRLATPAFGLLRNVEADAAALKDGKATVNVKKGDSIFVNFVKAGMDPEVFPEPEKIKLDRDPKLYIHHGWGGHACLGRNITTTALATQLACFSRLKNLRRAPGGQGEMKYKLVNDAFKVYMQPDWSDYWPFPTTMKVMFDEIEPW